MLYNKKKKRDSRFVVVYSITRATSSYLITLIWPI